MKPLLAFCVCCCLLSAALGRDLLAQQPAEAYAVSQGETSASSSASSSSSSTGQQSASTQSSATGKGATAAGISSAAGQVEACLSGPNVNSAACTTLAPRIKASNCTDIPPDNTYTCTQQADEYKKCDADFMFTTSSCLKSCNRCGDSCKDIIPEGDNSCDAKKCTTDPTYLKYPVCLKTCRRCSTAAA